MMVERVLLGNCRRASKMLAVRYLQQCNDRFKLQLGNLCLGLACIPCTCDKQAQGLALEGRSICGSISPTCILAVTALAH